MQATLVNRLFWVWFVLACLGPAAHSLRLRTSSNSASQLQSGLQGGASLQATARAVLDECFTGTKKTCAIDTSATPEAITKTQDQCKSKPGKLPDINTKVTEAPDCIEVTDGGPFDGACCCKYSIIPGGRKKALLVVLCDGKTSSASWTAPNKPPIVVTPMDFAAETKTLSDPGIANWQDAIGSKGTYLNDKKNIVELMAWRTEYPPSDVLDHIALRLEELDLDVKTDLKTYPCLAAIGHQVSLYRELLQEKSLHTESAFLKSVVLGVGNLHAAVQLILFIGKNPDALVPVVTGTGDHFLADSLVGHNEFNAFMLHPLQVQGHSDPHSAVAYLKGKVRSLSSNKSLQELLIRTLALDMSAWARMKAPQMRFNGAITDGDWEYLYDHVQDDITAKLDHYINELSKV